MPKTRYKKALQGGVRACNNLPQPNPYILVFGGCGRLLHALTPPRSAFLYLQFLARCHPYILLHFYTCIHSTLCYCMGILWHVVYMFFTSPTIHYNANQIYIEDIINYILDHHAHTRDCISSNVLTDTPHHVHSLWCTLIVQKHAIVRKLAYIEHLNFLHTGIRITHTLASPVATRLLFLVYIHAFSPPPFRSPYINVYIL